MANTLLWDPVPWMVGGGAQHSTDLGRVVAYGAYGGEEGIVSGKDCEVRELATPGPQVRVFPGVVAVVNRATGAAGEMYVGRLPKPVSGDPAPERVDIASTSAGGGRTDLIVARVENPWIPTEPWADPANPAVGPYIFTRVIQNVPVATESVAELGLGYSALALARVTLPASTAVITQSMVTDLRQLSSSKVSPNEKVTYPAATRALTSTTYANWPTDANMSVEIPSWATHVYGKAILGGVAWGSAAAQGSLRLRLGTVILGGSTTIDLPSTTGVLDRTTLMVSGLRTAVPASLRGTTATAQIEGSRPVSSVYSNLQATTTTAVSLELTFTQQPESNV